MKRRNTFAKSLGYECFYDMKVSQAEGFNKATLFSILDGLEERTRPALKKALELLAEEKGESALLPHNTGYFLAGDINKLKVMLSFIHTLLIVESSACPEPVLSLRECSRCVGAKLRCTRNYLSGVNNAPRSLR